MAGQWKVSLSLHGLAVSGKFGKTLDEQLQVLVRNAARAWLRALIIRVAVYTGFALGSVKFARGRGGELASFLNVSVPINPKHDRPKWYYPPGGGRVPKTPDQGGRFAQFSFPVSQHRYRFRFRDDVVHFKLNEFFSSVSPTSPWHAVKAAREAFKEHIRENVKTLPKIKKYIIKSKFQFLGGARG